MIPILYHREEIEFESNGLGRLSDCISCTVTEERNGQFECEFEYPIDGVHYSDIENGRIISCTFDETKNRQAFRIYRKSAPINGIVTFNARHISYDLRNVMIREMSATSCPSALAMFNTVAVTSNPFTFWTDKTTVANFHVDHPTSIREVMGGQQGSILDVYGGEWAYDNFTVRLYASRGTDSGATIRYGKNLTDLTYEEDDSSTYNTVIPYWTSAEGRTVSGGMVSGSSLPLTATRLQTEANIDITNEDNLPLEVYYVQQKVVSLDMTSNFEEEPTEDQLNRAALTYLDSKRPWVPHTNLEIDFVALWQTEEYKNIAPLERVKLCDTVNVYYPALGVEATARVIRTVYNVLKERYDKLELGDARTNFAEAVLEGTITEQDLNSVANQITSTVQSEIDYATRKITGGMGGHIVYHYDGNGKPTEILVMDTEDEATAVNVLRINVNGIGFSNNGANGPFQTAWTLDGHFVADFITAGTLDGAHLRCVNLNAVNASISGNLTTKEDDNNYIYIDSGQIQAIANGDQSLRIGSYQQNGDIVGNSLQLTDENGQMRGNLYINTVQDASGLSFYNANGVRTIALYNSPAYSDASYLRLFDTSSPNDTFSLVGATGIWLYHPNATNGVSASITPGSGIYTDTQLVCKGDLFAQSDAYVYGALVVYGSKNRAINTKDGTRLLNAYETAEPYFGDIGEDQIGENGKCVVKIDQIFKQVVDLEGYQVFVQKYGDGDLWVERQKTQFTVHGTPGLSFGWELKAHQVDHKNRRLEKYEVTI